MNTFIIEIIGYYRKRNTNSFASARRKLWKTLFWWAEKVWCRPWVGQGVVPNHCWLAGWWLGSVSHQHQVIGISCKINAMTAAMTVLSKSYSVIVVLISLQSCAINLVWSWKPPKYIEGACQLIYINAYYIHLNQLT